MRHTSEQFAMQAESDLAQAQAVARESSSGDDLGTAMFLAQQSIEKGFKSILLQVCEALAVDLDEGFFRDTLGHIVHLRPAEFYRASLEGIGYPFGGEPVGFVKKRLAQLGQVGKIWDLGFYSFPVRSLLFQYFLEAPMPRGGCRRLDAHLGSIFDKINEIDGSDESPRHRFHVRPSPDHMDAVISDGRLLQEYRVCYANAAHLARGRYEMERVFSSHLEVVNGIVDGHRLFPKATDRGHAMLAILDYGAFATAILAPSYVYLFPHVLFGRYPVRLHTRELSTDVYASQRNAILARLFVNVQHDHDQLRSVGERIDELRRIFQGGGLDGRAAPCRRTT